MHYLMHLYRQPAIFQLVNFPRLYLRIEHGPLTCPVIADAFMTMDVAALPAVRPLYVLCHESEHSIEIPRIEVAVCGLQDFNFLVHCAPSRSLAIQDVPLSLDRYRAGYGSARRNPCHSRLRRDSEWKSRHNRLRFSPFGVRA